MHTSRDPARFLSELGGVDADSDIGTETNHLVHEGQEGLAGVGHTCEYFFKTNQDVRTFYLMLERRLVSATHLRSKPNRAAEKAANHSPGQRPHSLAVRAQYFDGIGAIAPNALRQFRPEQFSVIVPVIHVPAPGVVIVILSPVADDDR
jgi:hypothetical protein